MGYYNDKTLQKFQRGYEKAVEDAKAGKLHVSISKANSKMGAIASVSMLPFLTCPVRCKESCGTKCYAAKLANLRPNVLTSYANNTALALHNPELYWKTVNETVGHVKYFRFHVSGDILNMPYLQKMVEVARNNPDTELLAFTKRYELINTYLDRGNTLPANLHILLSGWRNMKPINLHGLPETNVLEHGEEPGAGQTLCGGNCFNCAKTGCGCWNAQRHDVIVFYLH